LIPIGRRNRNGYLKQFGERVYLRVKRFCADFSTVTVIALK